MTAPACPSFAGYRFPAEIISQAVWLYFRFPLSLRMVEEMLAFRGIVISHETLRQWDASLTRLSPTRSAADCRGSVTSGTWMRSYSRSTV